MWMGRGLECRRSERGTPMVQMGQPDSSQWRWRDGLSAALASLLLTWPSAAFTSAADKGTFHPSCVLHLLCLCSPPSVLWILVVGNRRGTITVEMLSCKLLFLTCPGWNSLQQRNSISELDFCSNLIQKSIGTKKMLFSPDLWLPGAVTKEVSLPWIPVSGEERPIGQGGGRTLSSCLCRHCRERRMLSPERSRPLRAEGK